MKTKVEHSLIKYTIFGEQIVCACTTYNHEYTVCTSKTYLSKMYATRKFRPDWDYSSSGLSKHVSFVVPDRIKVARDPHQSDSISP